ncbi:di-heme oxidoredictase family protein [Oceanospirillum sanctuarii]|uniref:di-heme oxidoreductase family protein n=1 Tax=Oceanospirillum sanctuarii TaxID=1434821 RepID=UPI001C3E1B6B|nr:di-heme oxidoredictase family protein [Oceanospirillum sanctuarii]
MSMPTMHHNLTTRKLLATPLLASALLTGTLLAASTALSTPAFAEGDPQQNPRLGGMTSVAQSDRNAFSRPAANLSPLRQLDFKVGNSFFKAPWVMAPSSTTARDGLGPLVNTNACQNCHLKDGRGHVPDFNDKRDAMTEQAVSLFLRLSRPAISEADQQQQAKFGPLPDPVYGGQLQNMAMPGITPEGEMKLTYSQKTLTYPDGSQTHLRTPHYELINPAYGKPAEDLQMSPRIAPHMAGLGLLELIPEEAILANADPEDSDQNGISGKANRVWDRQQQASSLGRFGWKAAEPTLKQQNSGAFAGDMGLTTSLHTDTDCTQHQPCEKSASGGIPEVPDKTLNHVTFYTQHLAVPMQRETSSEAVQQGYQHFNTAGCNQCHIENWKTGQAADRPELSNQKIRPFTDLLLHDMGEDLADNRPEYLANGREWRTAPLWGVGINKVVTGQENYLHDGRARTLEEAILWHGGEAETAKNNFMSLPQNERQQLIRFLESL